MTDPVMPPDVVSATDEVTAVVEPTVTVNGLTMTVSLFARVVAALRGLFPDLATLSDAGLIQAVMMRHIGNWLATWEGRQATTDNVEAAVQKLRADYQAKAEAAAQQARSDAATIQPTVTT